MRSGWIPMGAGCWEQMVAILTAWGGPWPQDAVEYDLRWHVDQQKTLPGRGELQKRWNWEKEEHVKKLLARPDLWWDPTKKGEPPTTRKQLEKFCPVKKKAPVRVPKENPPGGPRSEPGDAKSPQVETDEAEESDEFPQVAPGDARSLQLSSIARSSPHPTPSPPPEEQRAREAPEGRLQLERDLDALLALQEQDEPQHEATRERDLEALTRALFSGVTLLQLRILWAWSGVSDDPDVAGCAKGGWRRFSSLLRGRLGEQRLRKAIAWDEAGRPAPLLHGPPVRAGPRRAGHAGDGVLEALMAKRRAREVVNGD